MNFFREPTPKEYLSLESNSSGPRIMPYKYLNIEFHAVEHLYDLEIPIRIFSSFLEALRDGINGANFNKYSDQHPRIQVRFKFEAEKEDVIDKTVFKVAKDLQEKGQIRYYDKKLEDWKEPEFVTKAHEIGTAWAVELEKWIKQDRD